MIVEAKSQHLFPEMKVRRCMIRVPIVPNSNVILSPLETNLDIMIVS
jgi:hypothetical protein